MLANKAQKQVDAGQQTPPLEDVEEQRRPQREGQQRPSTESTGQQLTACFNCRAVRQRCDRTTPCKPATVEKLLSRISESGVRDQVVAALLNPSHHSNDDASSSGRSTSLAFRDTFPCSADDQEAFHAATARSAARHASDNHPCGSQRDDGLDSRDSLIPPLHILADAVAAEIAASQPSSGLSPASILQSPVGRRGVPGVVDEKLAKYFAPQTAYQTDWQVLASQSVDNTFRLDATACDPITAKLIDQSDASWYFKLFVPLANAFAVPPAVHVARDLGIYRSTRIAEQVDVLASNATPDFRERLFRNFERTWLFVFIADKSFGIVTGCRMNVCWKKIPLSASEWWKKPMTGPIDRVVSGIVEVRMLLLNALEHQKRTERTLSSIFDWYSQSFEALDQLRSTRCASDGVPTAAFLPVLAFYMDHSIMVLNAQALRALTIIDADAASSESLTVSKKTLSVASRVLDLVLSDPVFRELMFGFHNHIFIMICHAVTETIQAIKRHDQALPDVVEAISKVREIPRHLERIAQGLPVTSSAHLYMSLSRVLVSQMDNNIRIASNGRDKHGSSAPEPHPDWWGAIDIALLDGTPWIDMGFLSSDNPFGSNDSFDTANEQNFGNFGFV
ncbi:hypothetical protein DL769_009394 [Monosporascus sp. CRB-8-3]|nr:hypothetical protein DL769_009394 [Monosporascus sp. CRB-8-3]